MLIVEAGARTDTGHVRRLNEDCLVAGHQLWAVADGMGGHAAGDVASAIVADRLAELDEQDVIFTSDLTATLRQANKEIVVYGMKHARARGLGSTVTGVATVVVSGTPHWAVFNVGDSRVYSLVDGMMRRITIDHSETEEMVTAGLLTPEQARNHPLRNVITRSLGSRPAPEVDMWLRPQVVGERLLICSDGLTSEVTDGDIKTVWEAHPDADDAATSLVEAALSAGGRDNISVIALNVVGEPHWLDEPTDPQADHGTRRV